MVEEDRGRLLLAAAAAKLKAKRGGPGGRRWRRQRGHWRVMWGGRRCDLASALARGRRNRGARELQSRPLRTRPNVPAAVARRLSTLEPTIPAAIACHSGPRVFQIRFVGGRSAQPGARSGPLKAGGGEPCDCGATTTSWRRACTLGT
ncbi:hypothetical protein PVAP13_9KG497900 [Panicum virgatum]|uniref:Uncharacterized protein n=1 Tax=Panicum virgatum TaxID=38727 RepID=A0A8T0P3H5_PANVG|nr:hypothetical protein PVAP13_9KG497900 [Panicum virgatum]